MNNIEEIRCTKCNKLLFKYDKERINKLINYKVKFDLTINPTKKINDSLQEVEDTIKGIIEIQCPRCKEMNTK